jgi:hypothetical protein
MDEENRVEDALFLRVGVHVRPQAEQHRQHEQRERIADLLQGRKLLVGCVDREDVPEHGDVPESKKRRTGQVPFVACHELTSIFEGRRRGAKTRRMRTRNPESRITKGLGSPAGAIVC